MQEFHDWINWLNGYLWGPPMLVLLFGTHLFLTFRLRFIQKHTWTAIKLSVSKDAGGEGDVSQFGALTTALAATIGTGNIVGVATAISLGGPGAIFWMWCTALVGMATKFCEATLAVKFRDVTPDGSYVGGPMYYIKLGLGKKWLWMATAFAIFGVLAMLGRLLALRNEVNRLRREIRKNGRGAELAATPPATTMAIPDQKG